MLHRLHHSCKCLGINARLYNSRTRTNAMNCDTLALECAGGLLDAVQVAAADRGILQLLNESGMNVNMRFINACS
jgi:hypothetical protein